ncbi:MAG: hypothetical protein U0625_03915 [Phycisphaerales bacterium]
MSNRPIDYFAPSSSLEEAVIRRIKGDHRKVFIAEAIRQDGLDSIPPQWTAHNLDELFKTMLMSRNPRNRGGEDLPDLDEGEVEVARVSLADSVHGEVTSLRARKAGGRIQLRMVDEYESEFDLPQTEIAAPFSAGELIAFFAACEPCPFDTDCRLRIASPFYEGLQRLLDSHLERAGGDANDDDERDD